MDSHPDKIFRDKLAATHRPAPPGAWERIERNIARPKAYYKWMGIAAGILVVVVSGYLVWSLLPLRPLRLTLSDHQIINSEQKETLSDHQITNSVQKTIPNESDIANNDQKEALSDHQIINSEQKALRLTLSDREFDAVQIPQKANRKISVSSTAINETQEVDVDKKIDLPETDVVERIIQIKEPDVQQSEILATESLTEDKKLSRTIVYNVEDVNARFLKKNVTPEKSNVVVDQPKDIRQNTSFVYVLKNNEYGMGDLRQIKDEILTLDFLAHNDKIDKSKNR